ncbi:metalloregulator ArsR/SmtB family transcription factor [Intrasporangium sp.]|uniref:ArsR/SmtB family transcription factor n=1 Tax=Intrasporangium sp. TaxID=1925024 RepID=UPI002939AC0C|nr:metalloregulator ArsR/SmtB family transcription factor [Intrasporangium sp.]MDV3221704.1 metalloregulator ArsR/SmtB family transcription factor [Intrasporangium sp.]
MSIDPGSVADFGAALAHPSRVRICLALLDGRAWTAGELARAAGVTKSTASEHLSVLVAAGLLAQERQGRHRYLRLASPEAAELVDSVATFAGRPAGVSSFRAASVRDDLAKARTCYDHLAGALGVAIYDALLRKGVLTDVHGLAVTPGGEEFITRTIGVRALTPQTRRPLARTCLDWTERRHHLGGHLASVLREAFVEREWVIPLRTHRALRLTTAGADALRNLFDTDPTPWLHTDATSYAKRRETNRR